MSQVTAVLPSMLEQPWARALGWALIYSLLQGAIVVALVVGGLALLRRASPQARYALACGGLLVMLVLPAATWWSLYHVSSPAASAATPTATPFPALTRAHAAGITDSPMPTVVSSHPVPCDTPWAWGIEKTVPVFVAVWLLGVTALALWRTGGLVYAVWLCRCGTRPAAPAWQERLTRLRRRLRVGRPVALLESLQVQAPVVIGWLRPVILVPVGMFAGLSVPQLDAILAHELVHVRRWDFLVNLLQTTAENLLFYHPAVWWISHRIRVEREYCCDDEAAACSGSIQAYTGALAALEAWVGARPLLGMAAGGGSLLDRIRRQLAARSGSRTGGWGLVLALPALVLMAGLVGLPGAGYGVARDRGEIVWYPFDGPGVVTGPALRIHGAIPSQDRFGTPDAAYRFDGGSAVVEMEEAVQGDFLTIAFWARSEVPITADSPRGYNVMGSCVAGISDDANGVTMGPCTDALDNEVLTLRWESSYKAFYWTTATLPQGIDTAWHHYVFVWDDPDGTYALYLDGRALGAADVILWNNCTTEAPRTSPVPTWLGNRRWQFGRGENQVGRGWLGAVDGVRIWDRPLSGAEVKGLCRANDSDELEPRGTQVAGKAKSTEHTPGGRDQDPTAHPVIPPLSAPSVIGGSVRSAESSVPSDPGTYEMLTLMNSSPRTAHYDLTATGPGCAIEPRECDLASRQRQVLRLTEPVADGIFQRVCLTAELTHGPLAPGASLADSIAGFAGVVAYTAFRSPDTHYTLVTVERDTPEAVAVRAYVRDAVATGVEQGQVRR